MTGGKTIREAANARVRRESYRRYLKDYYVMLLLQEQINERLDDVEQFLDELRELQPCETRLVCNA